MKSKSTILNATFSTVFAKKIFPLVWSGFIGALLLFAVSMARINGAWFASIIVAAFFLLMIYFGVCLNRYLLRGIADRVLEEDGQLIVEIQGERVRIPLQNVKRVTHIRGRPEKLVLNLREPCQFGNKISFIPKGWSSVLFYVNPIAADLTRRLPLTDEPLS